MQQRGGIVDLMQSAAHALLIQGIQSSCNAVQLALVV